MRVGMNPQKKKLRIKLHSNHRVVIVVFIPETEGYYATVFEVMKLCLDSVYMTKSMSCEITVVNNGSCIEVTNYLNKLYEEDKINCLINHRKNIGKIDALIGAARTAREELVTLSDVDILFVKGWQEAIEEVFNAIPDVGLVSPISIRTAKTYATFSTLSKIILKKINFKYETIPENFEAYNRFLESINWEKESNTDLNWPVIEKNGVKAIVGSNHQVVTVRRSLLFDYVPITPSMTLVGNSSEYNYVDLPVDLSGKMRLSTYHNYAFHMGNKVEEWMLKIHEKNITNVSLINEKNTSEFQVKQIKPNVLKWFVYRLKKKIVKPLFLFFYKE